MQKTHIQLAIRHLLKHKSYAFINIFGLSIGVAACLLIFRIVYYELSFDTFHAKYNRIVRVVTHDWNEGEGEDNTTGIPIPAMDEMQQTVTQFEQFARVHSAWPTLTVPNAPGSMIGAKYATDGISETALFTEPAFFSIFDWKWLSGDPQSALSEPNTIVLTKKIAEKGFGTWQMAVGKTVVLDNLIPVTVQGIVENAPDNSDFQINYFISYPTLKANAKVYDFNADWGNTSSNDQAFALLSDENQVAAAASVLANVGQTQYNNGRGKRRHEIQRLQNMHYDEVNSGAFGTHATEKSRLWVLSLIGAMVLLMACFNFVNLATAQASARSREVGVRKSLGGNRFQLARQFMGETTVIVAIAVLAGAALAQVCSPLLKYVSDVPDAEPFLSNPIVLLFMLVSVVLVSAFSGFYPAIVLSGFDPIKALKNSINTRTSTGVPVRKILVVGQFVVAQALIIGTIVTISQMNFLQKMDLGFKPDLVYVLQGVATDSSSLTRFERFKAELKNIPHVQSVSLCSDMPASNNNWASNFALNSTKDAPFSTFMKFVDADYFDTYGLRLIAGRALEPSDTIREVIVNQTLLKKLGITDPNEAIGKPFRMGGRRPCPVVGVVADFTANTARDEMRPMMLTTRKRFYSNVGIKLEPGNMAATTGQIQHLYEQVFPEQVFDGEFMDAKIAKFYKDEERFSALCKGFAALAILISCLGLYGLAALMAAQRTKEIGVRKVLGASVTSVVTLLSKDFLLLVIIAAFMAVPLAWYAMGIWLEDFQYRTPLSWWIFALTVLLACAVALLTVGIRTWSAARANPVKSLRSE